MDGMGLVLRFLSQKIPLQMTKCHHVPSTRREPFSLGENSRKYQLTGATIFFTSSVPWSVYFKSHTKCSTVVKFAELPTSWNILMQQKMVPKIWQTLQTPGTPLQSRMSKSTNPSSRKTMTSFARSDGWKSFRFSRTCLYHRIHGTGIFTYMYHTNQPNVGAYIIHGSYAGMGSKLLLTCHLHTVVKKHRHHNKYVVV